MKAGNIILAVLGTVTKVVVAVLVVYVIYNGAIKCYDYGYRIFTEPAISAGEGRTVSVTVTPSMGPADIGKALLQKGLIRDDKLFILQYYCSEYRKDVQPGEFQLSTAMTVEEMMAAMAAGETAPREDGESEPESDDLAQDLENDDLGAEE